MATRCADDRSAKLVYRPGLVSRRKAKGRACEKIIAQARLGAAHCRADGGAANLFSMLPLKQRLKIGDVNPGCMFGGGMLQDCISAVIEGLGVDTSLE